MTSRDLIVRPVVAAVAAAVLVASGAAAMPARDVVGSAALLPARVDADAHAVTIRAIGVARIEQARS
jgi:hypothetical protein